MELKRISHPDSIPFTKSESLSISGDKVHNDNRQDSSPTPAGTFTARLLDKNPEMAQARAIYMRIFFGGSFITVLLIFAVFPIFWGALWKTPASNLQGWIVVGTFPFQKA